MHIVLLMARKYGSGERLWQVPTFGESRPITAMQIIQKHKSTLINNKHQHTTLVIPVKRKFQKAYTLSILHHAAIFGFLYIFLFLFVLYFLTHIRLSIYIISLYYLQNLFGTFQKRWTPNNQRNKNKKIMHKSVLGDINWSKWHQI